MNDNLLMLIFSLPYLYDFSVGIMSVIFISRVADFNENEKILNRDKDEDNRNLLHAV